MHIKSSLAKHGISVEIPPLVTVIFVVLNGALAAVVFEIIREFEGKSILKQPLIWVVGLVALATLAMSILVTKVLDRVQKLSELIGMKFTYYPSRDGKNTKAAEDMYNAARRVIERAKDGCEILAVNSFHEKFSGVGNDNGAHERYFEALRSKLGKVHYRRLVQCETEEQLRQHLADGKEYQDYFAAVIEYRDAHAHENPPYRLQLNMVKPVYPTAFVLIKQGDGTAELIWQLNQYTDKVCAGRSEFTVRGLLLVSDPQQRLTKYFEGWFNTLEGKNPTSITYECLPGKAGATT